MADFPITFGQQYGSAIYGADPHPVLDIYQAKDGYLIVEADTRQEAREKAFNALGTAWAFDYEKVEDLDPEKRGWYPLGEIARILRNGELVVWKREEKQA